MSLVGLLVEALVLRHLVLGVDDAARWSAWVWLVVKFRPEVDGSPPRGAPRARTRAGRQGAIGYAESPYPILKMFAGCCAVSSVG